MIHLFKNDLTGYNITSFVEVPWNAAVHFKPPLLAIAPVHYAKTSLIRYGPIWYFLILVRLQYLVYFVYSIIEWSFYIPDRFFRLLH
jgi:hypothetical protein